MIDADFEFLGISLDDPRKRTVFEKSSTNKKLQHS